MEHLTKRDFTSKFLKLLDLEKKVLLYLFIYAAVAGIILLTIPLGIQAMIGFISSGKISTSVIVLIGFVLLGLLVSGGLQIMQLYLVEHIQQKLFVNTAFDYAYRIPKMKMEALFDTDAAELVNRFFDVVSLQKGFGKLLTDFSAAILQIIFGLLLLSFYHPYFIFFGILLLVILILILRFTGPQGMDSSLDESKYKYKMANWLQEIARSTRSFKISGESELAMTKTDDLVNNYLNSRKKHFKVLAVQYFSFVGFKTFVTGGLLVLGGILLIEQEINLGQFVASEIIIILTMTAVEKIMIKLNVVYDVFTSLEKMDQVSSVPLDKPRSLKIENVGSGNSLSLKIVNLHYKYPNQTVDVIKGLNLSVSPGEKIGIRSVSNSGKTTLINLLLGVYDGYEGVISYDNVSLRELDRENLHKLTGNDSLERLFDATVEENIKMGRKNISMKDIMWTIEVVGLSDFVQNLQNGVKTQLIGGNTWISHSTERKIIMARYLVKKPRLLILSDLSGGGDNILKVIESMELQATAIFFTHDRDILENCSKIFELKHGELVETDLMAMK